MFTFCQRCDLNIDTFCAEAQSQRSARELGFAGPRWLGKTEKPATVPEHDDGLVFRRSQIFNWGNYITVRLFLHNEF